MRVIPLAVMVLVGLDAGATIARAESPEGQQPLPSRSILLVLDAPDGHSWSAHLADIERWTHDYAEWRAWFEQWRNRREPGWFGTRQRRERPDPPPSLAAACPVASNETGVLADACRYFAEWRDDDAAAAIAAQQATAARAQHERARHTVWWQHVHLDALWPVTQGQSGMFGVVGLHTTIKVSGRIQVFVAPGAILMRVPDATGGRQWKPATDWGFSYRVVDFTLPRARRPSTLHLNLAKVWLLGGRDNLAGVDTDMYLAGLSLTFRKAGSL
jgi:hypothetical protein